jgi:hypothetical protein
LSSGSRNDLTWNPLFSCLTGQRGDDRGSRRLGNGFWNRREWIECDYWAN